MTATLPPNTPFSLWATAALCLIAATAPAFGQSLERADAAKGDGRGDGIGTAVVLASGPSKTGDAVERVGLGPLDVDALVAQDAAAAAKPGSKSAQRIGVVRPFARAVAPRTARGSPRFATAQGGTRTWTFEVGSEGAVGQRVRICRMFLPPGAELICYDADEPTEVYGPWTGKGPHGNGAFYTPTVFGENVRLELRVPIEALDSPITLEIDGLCHRYAKERPADSHANRGNFKVGSCHNEVACDADYSATEARAVALYEAIDGAFSFNCTGTLLNDLDTSTEIPWFLTANHCVTIQSIATTVECFWDYRTSTCNGSVPTLQSRPRTLGATLVATSSTTDVTLLRLTGSLPSNRAFAGWSADTQALDEVVGVHHPDASHMRISYGDLISQDRDFHTVRWFDGVTEQGSSGSALFNAAGQVIGQLCCGASACNFQNGTDDYGRFDVSFDTLSLDRFLLVEPPPTTDDDQWDPADDMVTGALFLGAPQTAPTRHGPHTLSATDTADWFAFDLTGGTVYLFQSTGASDVVASLFDDAVGVNQVATDDDGGGAQQFRLQFTATATRTYRLRVQEFGADGDAEYSLWYSAVGVGPKPVAKLHAKSNRKGYVKLKWKDQASGEIDYRVELLEGETWVEVAVLKRNAKKFRQKPGPGAGVHTYRVGPRNDVAPTYTEVQVEVVGRGNDATDPDDDRPDGANPLVPALNGTTPNHTLSKTDLRDWYRIDLEAGRTYTFESTGRHDPRVSIYDDPTGPALADDDDSGASDNFALQFTPTTSGTFWVKVEAFKPGAKVKYRMFWNRQ